MREKLAQALDGPAPDGGLWTSKQVAAWVEQELGVEHIPIPRAWELLQQLGYRAYAPRPRHRTADPGGTGGMEKKLPNVIQAIRAAHPEMPHWDLWTMDEHRMGLKPILRRIWAHHGERPSITVQHRYQWRYLYGFVCPQTGETVWLMLPRVAVEVFSPVLSELVKFLGPDKHIMRVMDQAGGHTSERVDVPEGIHLVFQPAYSPELQPTERLGAVPDEALANQWVETIDDLENAQADRFAPIRTQQEDIQSRTLYH